MRDRLRRAYHRLGCEIFGHVPADTDKPFTYCRHCLVALMNQDAIGRMVDKMFDDALRRFVRGLAGRPRS